MRATSTQPEPVVNLKLVGFSERDVKTTSELTTGLITVGELLADPSLTIPQYQRPYKWTIKNVNELFSDISLHIKKKSYRLGTIVFHHEGDNNYIVDGQQRTVTLILAIRALIQLGREKKFKRKDIRQQLEKLKKMVDPSFQSKISQTNIHNNYLEISRIVGRSDFTEEHIDFLLNKCRFVSFTLDDISEAFQFFDSQNARGRDLEPHDLLKAFHLREFSDEDEELKSTTVKRWENSETGELATLFAMYLYRIRNWTKGESARHFSKDDTALFKGVNIDNIDQYPYVKQLRISHHFVDSYNAQYERRVDGGNMPFPFQLDDTVINGRRFFEMADHYQTKVKNIKQELARITINNDLEGYAKDIIETIDSYGARKREGDKYVRDLFDCLLISYIDKFGDEKISRAIEKAFIWAYSLRLTMRVVQLASADNYAIKRQNLFKLVKDSTKPEDFLTCSLPVLGNINSTKTDEIVTLFTEMKYYER